MSVYLVRGTALYSLPFSLYPDNTPVLSPAEKIPYATHVRGMFIQHTSYQYFVAAMMFATENKKQVGENLWLPYIPGARQDKPRATFLSGIGTEDMTGEGDVLDPIRYTARLIQMAGFIRVFTLDAHSSEVKRIFNDFGLSVVDDQSRLFESLVNMGVDGVIAPDGGAAERAMLVAKNNEVPLLIAKKHRDQVTNKITDYSIKGLRPDEHYLVVDDICDAGGTFVALGEAIETAGATADLYVTHGLFTYNAMDRLAKYYRKVFTTNSVAGNYTNGNMVTLNLHEFYFPGNTINEIEAAKR